MKTRFTLLFVLVAIFFSTNAQQLTNAGLNTWTNAANPDGWSTFESATGLTGVAAALVTRDLAFKIEGAASAKIITDSVQAGLTKRLVGGILNYGASAYSPMTGVVALGAPFVPATVIDTILFLFSYAPAAGDSAYATITLVYDNGNEIGTGKTALPTIPVGQWAALILPLGAQLPAGNIDSIRASFGSSKNAPRLGSVLHIDAFTIIYAAAPTVEYNVLTASAPANGGTTTGFGSYTAGTSVTVTATPNTNFAFTNWTANGVVKSTNVSYTFTVNSDTTLVANFTQTVGISDLATASISIYPNPVNEVLNVAIENTTSTINSSVVDVTGKVVVTQTLGNGINSINLSNVANGVYILRIVDNAGNTVRQERFNVAK